MAQATALNWKRHVSAIFGRSDNGPIVLANADGGHHVALDTEVSYVVGEYDATPAIVAFREVVLMPTPPPLPTHEMLVAATRALHPHQIPNRLPPPYLELPDASRPSISSASSASWANNVIHSFETPSASETNNVTQSIETPSENLQQCVVCMENRKITKFPVGKVTERCFHPSLTCSRCLQYSIASDHTTKMWNNICCPQCYQKLSYAEVERHADAATFAHYDLLTTRLTLSKIPDFVWCTSCPSGQLHAPPTLSTPASCPAVTCNACSAITCFNHRIPWHAGLSCSQYDRLLQPSALIALKSLFPWSFSSSDNLTLKAEGGTEPVNVKVERGEEGNLLEKVKGQRREMKASERDINRVCKRCPGAGCGAMIFKIDGCRHMTCLKCTHEFCWRCKRNWFYGHKCWKWWGGDY